MVSPRGAQEYMARILGPMRCEDLRSARVTSITVYKPCFSEPLVSTKLTEVRNNSLKWRPRSRLILSVSAYRYFFCFSSRGRDRLFPPVTLCQVRDTPRTKDQCRRAVIPSSGISLLSQALPSACRKGA